MKDKSSGSEFRKVAFVSDIVVEERMAGDYLRYAEFDPSRLIRASDGTMIGPSMSRARLDSKVEEFVVPVTEICSPGESDIYVAYSEKVRKFLALPFQALQNTNTSLEKRTIQLEDALARSNRENEKLTVEVQILREFRGQVISAGVWTRLKYLFGSIP